MRNTRRKTKIKLPAQIEWIECLFLNKLKDKKKTTTATTATTSPKKMSSILEGIELNRIYNSRKWLREKKMNV